MRPSPHFRPQARHASASPSPGGFAARLALHPTRLGANAGGNASAVEQPEGAAPTLTPGSGTPGVVHAAAAVTPPRPPPAILAVQLPPDQEAPVPQPQPGSSQRGGQPGGHHKRSGSGLPAGVAAMSPLRQGLQDVTNSPSLGHRCAWWWWPRCACLLGCELNWKLKGGTCLLVSHTQEGRWPKPLVCMPSSPPRHATPPYPPTPEPRAAPALATRSRPRGSGRRTRACSGRPGGPLTAAACRCP